MGSVGKDRVCGTPEWIAERMTETKGRLEVITSGCNIEMCDPADTGVSARVVGYKLDNAIGDDIIENAIKDGWQELVVIIEKDGKKEFFNLACIIALARKAVI